MADPPPAASRRAAPPSGAPTAASRRAVIGVLGIGQVLVWGSSYYLPAVLAKPVADATGWPLSWVIGGLSLGLLVSGLVSPKVGDLIERYGGRPVLMASAALLAAGLLTLAMAPNLVVFTLGWLVIGAAMGAGLYDPAFATIGRLYGQGARAVITSLTLIGGFASTVCWPLSALLLEHLGWRGTCLAYAAVNLFLVLPLYRFGLPAEPRHIARPAPAPRDPAPSPRRPPPRGTAASPAVLPGRPEHDPVLRHRRGDVGATAGRAGTTRRAVGHRRCARRDHRAVPGGRPADRLAGRATHPPGLGGRRCRRYSSRWAWGCC